MVDRSSFGAPMIVQPRTIEAVCSTITEPGPAPGIDRVAPLAWGWQCDLSDDSLRWTSGVFDLFGIRAGTRLDRRDTVAMYTEESRAMLERLRSDAVANRRSFTFEAQIHRVDGEIRRMRVTADVACSNGRATHLYGQKQDITNETMLVAIHPSYGERCR